LIDARENVKYFIFFHPLMLFGNLNSVNLPTQIVKVPLYGQNACFDQAVPERQII